jgi:hypothetical protein
MEEYELLRVTLSNLFNIDNKGFAYTIHFTILSNKA